MPMSLPALRSPLEVGSSLALAGVLETIWSTGRMVWLIPLAVVIFGVRVFVRTRRRTDDRKLTTEPVSGEWLAHARSRDEERW